MKRIIFMILCGLLGGLSAFSQSLPTIIPPSPTAAAFARYGEIPVDYSTGVPKIEIPVYTLKEGSLTLPISISYHASGIKVKDIASEVGLGWVLNAGGIISRTIMGKPDDYPANYAPPYHSKEDIAAALAAATTDNAKVARKEELDAMYQNLYEMQSDRYTFNFDGHAGLFRYDFITGMVKTIPYTPLKITLTGSPPTNVYEITDEAGIIYTFSAQEYSNGYISSWRIKTITSSDHQHVINFYYSPQSTLAEMYVSPTVNKDQKWVPTSDGGAMETTSTEFKNNLSVITHNPLQLDSIVTTNAVVRMTYSTDRHDAGNSKLTQITVLQRNTQNVISAIMTDQSYFGENTNPNKINSRLRLDRLRFYGSNMTLPPQIYSFEYDNSSIPFYDVNDASVYNYTGRFGFGEDYWGYYNGSNADFPKQYMSFLQPGEINTYGGDRNPVPYGATMCVIKTIRYPTGGSTIFDFSSNGLIGGNFYNYATTYPSILGGVKVDKITNYASDNHVAIVKTYEYSNVNAQTIDAYQFYYQQPVTHIVEGIYPAGNRYSNLYDTQKQVLVANALYALGQSNGASCIYTSVTEYIGDKSQNSGKSVYNYVLPEPYGILQEALSRPQYLTAAQYDRGSYTPFLASKSDYRFNPITGDYTLLKSLNNVYGRYHQNSFHTGVQVARTKDYVTEGSAHVLYANNYTDLGNYLNEFEYDNTVGYEDVRLLDNTITTDNSDPSNPVVQTTNYTYANLEHLQPTQKAVTSSSGDTWITQYKYPHDFASQFPYDQMVNTLHNWSPVIEELLYKNNTGNFLQSTKTEYSAWNGNNAQIYPLVASMKKGTADYDPRVQFWGYDTKGNVQSVSKVTGAKVNYVWGYGGTYPVAQVANADIASIVSILGGQAAVDSFRDNMSPSDAAVISYINLLRNAPSLSTAQITTYTYKPLVGITSVIDARGNKSTYEYDSFQRLVNIKDQHGNIKTHYCYNYAGQITDCSTLVN